ncbi:branched-chain amino acid ABC transporter permease [Haladaptatus halobius]|uniref:branched-chain amino acid ABC transporter permease n=1 Tax=Haladaptatus halobius TaxID=2884875 RepID=UPI001D0AB757|nr:branched-chain amino acid ABC transporter permease [Haladaptatus halobius]
MSDATGIIRRLRNRYYRLHQLIMAGRTGDAVALLSLITFVVVMRPLISSNLLLGYKAIANTILVWMLFATAFNLLLGYTGLLSFGHALFLGIGMYSIAIILSRFSTGLFFPAVLVALVTAGVVGYVIARLIVQKGDIYFAMLTIAFGEVGWYVANADIGGLTGGSDGIAIDVLPPWIESELGEKFIVMGGLQIPLYWMTATVFVVCVYLLFRIVRSPFGRTLIAIRENEELARSIGINTTRYKVWAFTLSALFTAIAGIMLELVKQGVTTNSLHWSTSGEVVMMTVLGGMSSFVGPMAGAFFWEFGADYLTSFQTLALPLSEFAIVTFDVKHLMEYWRFLFGFIFVLIILTRPEDGAWGIFKNIIRWISKKINDLGGNQ